MTRTLCSSVLYKLWLYNNICAGYQYGHIPWADADVTVLVDERGVPKFCLQELSTKVYTCIYMDTTVHIWSAMYCTFTKSCTCMYMYIQVHAHVLTCTCSVRNKFYVLMYIQLIGRELYINMLVFTLMCLLLYCQFTCSNVECCYPKTNHVQHI